MVVSNKCDTCPVSGEDCLGRSALRLCLLARERDDYRRALIARAGEAEPIPQTTGRIATPEELEAVTSCPHRGSVLPVSLQPGCGCRELSECRAGRGTTVGRVTLRDCLACIASGAPRSS